MPFITVIVIGLYYQSMFGGYSPRFEEIFYNILRQSSEEFPLH
jgi:hypothetical protein